MIGGTGRHQFFQRDDQFAAMHPRNLYKNGVDLLQIYKNEKDAREFFYLDSNGQVKLFQNWRAEMFLTKFLLQRNGTANYE